MVCTCTAKLGNHFPADEVVQIGSGLRLKREADVKTAQRAAAELFREEEMAAQKTKKTQKGKR